MLSSLPRYDVVTIKTTRDIRAQTRLIKIEGIDNVDDLAYFNDTESDQMADRNSKRSPVNQRVLFVLKRTKYLKAICHWVCKNTRKGMACNVCELTPALIAELIQDMTTEASKEDSDSTLYYPEVFTATDYRNWIKKVKKYLDSRTGRVYSRHLGSLVRNAAIQRRQPRSIPSLQGSVDQD